jgi:hypothetical protein
MDGLENVTVYDIPFDHLSTFIINWTAKDINDDNYNFTNCTLNMEIYKNDKCNDLIVTWAPTLTTGNIVLTKTVAQLTTFTANSYYYVMRFTDADAIVRPILKGKLA